MIERQSFPERAARWVSDWGIWLTPFQSAEIDEAMAYPGGVYITAFCQVCRKRIRHKLWLKPLTPRRRGWPVIYARYAYCLLCHRSWRYSGQRLSQRRNLL
jgi:hypothetical protein